jgi:Tfp pilus assembly pilus retraction ATPase PilT
MQLTDLHIKMREPEKSIAYPGPRLVEAVEMPMLHAFLAKLEGIDRDDFMVEFDGTYWRGRQDKQAVDGTWFRLRRMADVAPVLDRLPSPMPAAIKNILMSTDFSKGGLIHIAGGPGCGKTTTGSATLVSRLTEYGGVAYCVEDPPELPLNGWHGKGYCTQTWVAGDKAADWMESMRGVLRSQPTGTSVIMYVGEVRDPETARAMLRAASNGFLVISTGFGADIISGIDTFFQLIGRDHAASFAAVLRVIVHQKIEGERFHIQVLTSDSPSSQVANIIRSGQLAQLGTELTYQRNQLMANPAASARAGV